MKVSQLKIQIDDNLSIESDEYCYIVRKHRAPIKQTAKKRSDNSYHPTLERCKTHILKLKIAESQAETLGQLLREVEIMANDIESKIAAAKAK